MKDAALLTHFDHVLPPLNICSKTPCVPLFLGYILLMTYGSSSSLCEEHDNAAARVTMRRFNPCGVAGEGDDNERQIHGVPGGRDEL